MSLPVENKVEVSAHKSLLYKVSILFQEQLEMLDYKSNNQAKIAIQKDQRATKKN